MQNFTSSISEYEPVEDFLRDVEIDDSLELEEEYDPNYDLGIPKEDLQEGGELYEPVAERYFEEKDVHPEDPRKLLRAVIKFGHQLHTITGEYVEYVNSIEDDGNYRLQIKISNVDGEKFNYRYHIAAKGLKFVPEGRMPKTWDYASLYRATLDFMKDLVDWGEVKSINFPAVMVSSPSSLTKKDFIVSGKNKCRQSPDGWYINLRAIDF